MQKYLDLGFSLPFATDSEIESLGHSKCEVNNLDNADDGNPSVQDMLITFRYGYPRKRDSMATTVDDRFCAILEERTRRVLDVEDSPV